MPRHFNARIFSKAIRLISVILFALAILGPVDDAEARKRLCAGDEATLDCLKKNFDELHEKALYHFMIIIGGAEQKAVSCTSSADTVAFLEVAKLIGDNLEVQEYFHDIIETNLLRKKPECLLDALVILDGESRDVIVGYLKKPSFIKKAEVETILLRFKDDERYRELLVPLLGE